MRHRNSKLAPVLRAMTAFTAPHTPPGYEVVYDARLNLYYPVQRATVGRGHARPGWDYINDPDDRGHVCFEIRDDAVEFCIRHSQQQPAPVTCHRCGAVVDGDALTVQTMADGSPKLDVFLCRAHLVAGTERLKAAIREQREGQDE